MQAILFHIIMCLGLELQIFSSTSNVGIGGTWAFRLDEEENPVITCSDTSESTIDM